MLSLPVVTDYFQNLRTANALSWKNAYNQTRCYTYWQPLNFLFFFKQSCTYLVRLLPLTSTAEFCASLMNDSISFGILELGTVHGNQLEVVHMNIRQMWSLFCFHVVLHAEATITQKTADWYDHSNGGGTEVLADSSSQWWKNKSELFMLSFLNMW